MDIERIKEIIYSKCKVYRKEEENPFKEDCVEQYSWRIEKTMMDFRIGNFENKYNDYASLPDDKIANLIVQHIKRRYFQLHSKAGESYEQLMSLPFVSK